MSNYNGIDDVISSAEKTKDYITELEDKIESLEEENDGLRDTVNDLNDQLTSELSTESIIRDEIINTLNELGKSEGQSEQRSGNGEV